MPPHFLYLVTVKPGQAGKYEGLILVTVTSRFQKIKEIIQ